MSFEVGTKSKCITISCHADFKPEEWNEAVRTLADMYSKLPQGSIAGLLVTIAKEVITDSAFYDGFALLAKLMATQQKKVFVIRAPPGFEEQIKNRSLESSVTLVQTEEEALKEFKTQETKTSGSSWTDSALTSAFINSVTQTLAEQGGITAKPGLPEFKNNKFLKLFDIAGLIGYTSIGVSGLVAICFPSDVYLFVMSKMLSENFPTITDEIADGAAELTNIISGQAREILSEADFPFALTVLGDEALTQDELLEKAAIPSVARGEAIPFKTDSGTFHLVIEVRETTI